MKKIFIISILLLLGCQSRDDNILAVIGTKTITTQDFINRYRLNRQKLNLPDNGQVRSETLRNMIDELLLISQAEARGYHTDYLGQYELEKIKIQELINAYLQVKVFARIQVQEADLRSLFINLNSMIKARHLYADSKQRADSLYQLLMSGYTFEELAKEIFIDPRLRDSGGLLGYFTVDEMDAGFEESAFSLPIGQISRPVRTAQGYSIIQVLDRITKPMLTESEYLKNRDKLQTYCMYRLKKRTARSFSDSLSRNLKITYNLPVLQELFELLRAGKSDLLQVRIENASVNDGLADKEIARSNLGNWTIRTLQEQARFTTEEQRNWIENHENLQDFIAGLIVRSYILTEAKEMNLHSTAEYEVTVRQKMEDYLYQRVQKTISAETEIPEDSLRSYYMTHEVQYTSPPRIHLSEIVLENEFKANEVKKLLLKNLPFDSLAKTYSMRRWSAEKNGEIGIYTEQELGVYAHRLMSLAEGDWTGPVRINQQYIFFKCLNKIPGYHQSYTEARPLIQKGLRPIWQNQRQQDFLQEARSHINLVMYPEKLKLIQLN